jgi:hypothetical protein
LTLLTRAVRPVRGFALDAVAIMDGTARFVTTAMLAVRRVRSLIVRCGVELRHFLREFCLFQLRLFRFLLLEAGKGGQAAAGQEAYEGERGIVDTNFPPSVG